ncbi:MAG: hypothetical protein K9W42_00050 [Candidatus Heimdallarchaeota archaeon]|nr:hypothetical protein [Candidatus Heimdallarchaeota archaeon]
MSVINEIRKELKNETNSDKRISLINRAKDIWDPQKPSWEFLAIVIECLRDNNETDAVKKAAINLLKILDIHIYFTDFKTDELFDELFFVLASQVDRFSNEHFDYIINIYIFIENFIQILSNQNEEFRKNHLKDILDIITDKIKLICKIPEKTTNGGIALYYLKMVHKILSNYSNWNATQQHYRLPVNEIWSIVEENIISFLEIDNKEIRSLCASLISRYGKTKGRLQLEKIIMEEDESFVLSQLMDALVEVGTKESRFVLMRVSQKGNQQVKENARECLNKLALKLGYNNGVEMINELKPTKSFTVRESIGLLTSFLSSMGLFFTILSVSNKFSNLNSLLITAVILLTLSILIILFIIVDHVFQIRKYKRKLRTWGIEDFF